MSGAIESCRFFGGVDWLWSIGASWHRDIGFGQYSALLVVVNTGIQIHQHSNGSICPSPGDLFILNIHKMHKAVRTNQTGEILCLCFDYESPITLVDARRKFVESIRKDRLESQLGVHMGAIDK